MRKIFWIVLYTAVSIGANAALADLAALRTGEMRKLVLAEGKAPVDFAVTLPDGAQMRLSEHRGKVVVLNFWATWCAPCKKEMPSLARLQAAQGSGVFVMPVATGRNSPAGISRFFNEIGTGELPILLDPKQEAARMMGVFGLPATILIDKAGVERGRLLGDAAWDSPEAAALIAALAAE